VYSGPVSLESPGTVTAAALRGALDFTSGDWSDLTTADYDVGEPPGVFIRGDCNRDARVDLADALKSLLILFAAGQSAPCAEACDANADSHHDISDAIDLLAALYQGGPAPPDPYPACGRSGADGGCDAPACP
jgi:hypothetical protein